LANNIGGMAVTPVRTGGAIAATGGTVTLEACTFSRNQILIQDGYPVGSLGSALFLDSCTATIGECLFAFNSGDAAIRCGGLGGATVSCSNVFGNPGGDWSGCIAGQAGNNGNFSADPLFCDTAIGDYHITDASPCAPINNSCGLLAGVFGVGCSGIPLQVKLLSPTESSGDPVYTLLPTFKWSASTDPDPFDTVRYTIEVSPLLSKDSLLSTSYVLSDTLRFGTRYLWRVTAWDKSHNAVTTPYESFWTWTLGDINKSNKCDLTDLSAMVSHLLGGGFVISPRRVGDLGGDCTIDLSDLVCLVSYLTGSGIALKPGCE
jgi:hypothetical protein